VDNMDGKSTSKTISVDPVALEETQKSKLHSATVEKADDLQYDIGNLYALDIQPIDVSAFRKNPERFLREYNRENVQLLFNRIFALPVGDDAVATLPAGTLPIPRAKPIPKERAKTRWDQYRALKGIQTRKRDRMVWDDEKQQWKPRWGASRVNSIDDQWVMEAKEGQDTGVEDPFLKMKQDKKKRVTKNQKNQLKNVKRAAGKSAAPNPLVANAPTSKELLKADIETALTVARKSSASVGRFDHNLPTEKPPKPKRKYEPVVSATNDEKQKSLKVLDRMFGKGELDVEKAVRNFTGAEQKERHELKKKAAVAKQSKKKAQKKGKQ